eukprot:13457-Heterococcus_DN1.PRE.2
MLSFLSAVKQARYDALMYTEEWQLTTVFDDSSSNSTVPLSNEQEKHALSQRLWQPLSTSPLAVENYDELLAFATDTAVQAVLASLQSTEQAPARIWLQKALHKYSQPEKAQDSQPQSSSSAEQQGSSSNSGDSSSSDSGSVAVLKFQHGKRGNDLLAALLENGLMIATSFKMSGVQQFDPQAVCSDILHTRTAVAERFSALLECALLYELLFFQEVPDDHSQLWRMLFQKSLEAASTQDGLDGSTDTDTDSSETDTA